MFQWKLQSIPAGGKIMKSYETLSAAIKACFKDDTCDVIFDASCDQYMYWTYSGGLRNYTDLDALRGIENTCSWIKSGIHLRLISNEISLLVKL